MFKLVLYLKKSVSTEQITTEQLGCMIEESTNKKTPKRLTRAFRWMKKIRIPFKNVSLTVNEENGLVYIFNNDKPWEGPWNIGTLIKNRLLRASQKVYW